MNGILAAVLAALLFGASTPLAKLLLGSIPPQMLAGLLYLGSGLGLGAIALVQRKPLPRGLGWLLGAVLFGGVLGPVLLMLGLARSTASTSSLLLNLEGVFTALLAWFVFRENFDRRIFLGMVSIVLGGVVLSWGGPGGFSSGALLVMGACLCWAIDNNLTQKVSTGDPLQIAAIKGFVAGCVNLALAWALGAWSPVPSRLLGSALVLGLFGYGVSLVMFVLGLRLLGTARTGAYFSLAPFAGAVLAVLVLGDPVGWRLLAAAGLMGLGVYLHLTEVHSHEHTHEYLEHCHEHTHDEHHQHEHEPGLEVKEPHTHWHVHHPMTHSHPHYPDIHHRHEH